LAEQDGEQADLIGIRGAGNGSARQPDFQDRAAGFRGDLGNEEGGTVIAGGLPAATLPSRDPRREGGILDAALPGEVRRAEAAVTCSRKPGAI
jgi:hypothetical protein